MAKATTLKPEQAKPGAPEKATNATPAHSELGDLRKFYRATAKTMYEVTCHAHNGVIAIEVDIAGMVERRGHKDRLIVVPVDEMLLSYRTRGDGSMGYQCACKANSIVLVEEREFARQDMTLPHVKAAIKLKIDEAKGKNNKENEEQFTRAKVK